MLGKRSTYGKEQHLCLERPSKLRALSEEQPSSKEQQSEPDIDSISVSGSVSSKLVVYEDLTGQKFCICREMYDKHMTFACSFIACDQCNEWMHEACVGLTSLETGQMLEYVCPMCEVTTEELSTFTDGSRFTHSKTVLEKAKYYLLIKQEMSDQIQKYERKVLVLEKMLQCTKTKLPL
jgi:hypothetical protein